MTAERRAAMGQAAVEAAKAVGYVGAGTVEFIAHPDGRFYFMEMNTRLQVEHPVTEMITGLDLVEWQLRVAAGERLPLTQKRSWPSTATRSRRGSTPRIPTAASCRRPASSSTSRRRPSADVRVDTGVEEGDSITPFYDPMIAKLIVHAADRAGALARMRAALAQYRIVGVANNVEFLGRLVATASFANADLDTALIEREHAALFPPPGCRPTTSGSSPRSPRSSATAPPRGPPRRVRRRRLAVARARRLAPERARDAAPRLSQRRDDARGRRRRRSPAAAGSALLDGTSVVASAALHADGELTATLGGRRLAATVVAHGDRRHVFVAGRAHALAFVDLLGIAGAEHEEEGTGLLAPMPGKVIALLAPPARRSTRARRCSCSRR